MNHTNEITANHVNAATRTDMMNQPFNTENFTFDDYEECKPA